jgi:hypothetical protein
MDILGEIIEVTLLICDRFLIKLLIMFIDELVVVLFIPDVFLFGWIGRLIGRFLGENEGKGGFTMID